MPTILHVCFPVHLFGTEQSLLILINGLAKKGYRSVVAVPKLGPLTAELERIGIEVEYVPSMKPWLIGTHVPAWKRSLYNIYHVPFLLRTAFKLRNIISKYQVDLVHTSNTVVFDGALAAALSNKPHVWHIRDTIQSKGSLRFFFGATIARQLILKFSQRVIVISKTVGQLYLHSTTATQKVRVVYNGTDLQKNEIAVPVVDLRHSLDVTENAQIVALIAQLHPRKRHEDLIKAAVEVVEKIPTVRFLLVGDDHKISEHGQYLAHLIADLNLSEYFIWIDFQKEIEWVFNGIDLLVLPSEDEPFGRVIIEAMAASKPVVGTTVGGIPEIIVDGETGYLVPPKSPDKLARAIIKIITNPSLATSMGQAGRKRVIQNFAQEKYVDNVEAVYQELLNTQK